MLYRPDRYGSLWVKLSLLDHFETQLSVRVHVCLPAWQDRFDDGFAWIWVNAQFAFLTLVYLILSAIYTPFKYVEGGPDCEAPEVA